MAYAYGWGSTGLTGPAVGNVCPKDFPNILQETELTICTAEQSAAWPNNQGLVDGQLCAVGATSTSYSGDSGGPLTIKSGDQHVQVGDVSFGTGCPTLPLTGPYTAVFGRITTLRGWLEEKMPGATTCSNGFDADEKLTRNWSNSGTSRWKQQQQAETERRRQEDINKKKRKEEKKRRKAEKKQKKQEKKQKRKEAAAAAAAAAAAETTTELAAEETTLQ